MKTYMAFKQMHNFLSDLWKLYAEYAVSDLQDSDLEKLQKDVDLVREKYQDYSFSVPVLVEVLNEIERIAKDRRKP